jgi:sugar transferase (PEP-CTERM/EpsH1 system associated)
MKIFILLSRVPYPLEKGDKVRAFNQIKSLSRNHEIILYAISDQLQNAGAEEALGPLCKTFRIVNQKKNNILINMIRALLKGLPLQVGYFFNSHIKKEITEAIHLHKPDVIYCQLCRTAEYVKDIHGIPRVLDFMDAFSKGAERRSQKSSLLLKWFFKIESNRMLRYEQQMLDVFDKTTIISEQDKAYISNPLKKEISVISNGVDFDFFKSIRAEKKYDCVFAGNMNYPPNIDGAVFLAEKIFPLVLQKFPGARLLIAGANPSPRVKKLKSENIDVSGWMDDIRMAYASSRIFIAPLRMGSGVQNKILEAMSMGLPCITSALVAKPIGIGKDGLLVADEEEEYAQKIIALLKNPELIERITKGASEFVRHSHDWDLINKGLEDIFTGLVSTK